MIYDQNALLEMNTIIKGAPKLCDKDGRIIRDEIAPLLPISRNHFLEQVRMNRLPKPVKLGNKNLWRHGDLISAIQNLN